MLGIWDFKKEIILYISSLEIYNIINNINLINIIHMSF